MNILNDRFLLRGSVALMIVAGVSFVRQAGPDRNEHTVMSVLWFQRSAELRALCYQAFNLAADRIDQDLLHNKAGRKRAVVADIDETLLDNSPHSAKLIKENRAYPDAWNEWVNRAEAEPLPGAVEFMKYADSKGYDIFYVSNRSEKNGLEGTMKNLKAKGFPQVERDHMLLKTTESSKEPRRKTIEATHEIILLIGDNLNDLAEVFEKKSVEGRFSETDKLKREFGRKFIVLPNPMYGEWEGAVYGYKWDLTDEEKDAKRKEHLKGF